MSRRWPLPSGSRGRSAVARRDPQQPVGARREGPAVVVRIRLLDAEEDALRGGVGAIGRGIGGPELAHHRVPRKVGVVDEEAAVRREGRGKGEPEQAPLPAAPDTLADVEVGRCDELAVAHDPDPTVLLDDEQASAAVGRRAGEQGAGKPVGDRLEADRHGRRGRRCGRAREHGRRGGGGLLRSPWRRRGRRGRARRCHGAAARRDDPRERPPRPRSRSGQGGRRGQVPRSDRDPAPRPVGLVDGVGEGHVPDARREAVEADGLAAPDRIDELGLDSPRRVLIVRNVDLREARRARGGDLEPLAGQVDPQRPSVPTSVTPFTGSGRP